MRIGVILFLSIYFTISAFSQSNASNSGSTIIDTVTKIKEDDEGKLILLNQNKKVLYLKNEQKNYDILVNEISNSLKFNTPLKFKTDANLNIIDAK